MRSEVDADGVERTTQSSVVLILLTLRGYGFSIHGNNQAPRDLRCWHVRYEITIRYNNCSINCVG